MRPHRLKLIVSLFLTLATLAVYWQVKHHHFVDFDDDLYITENRHVQAGLTPESVVWAFTTTDVGFWYPLTWMSHMLDCQLYGLNPAGHHFTSLLLHVANALLLFLVLQRMTGALWSSAFVAALFALHPLHVESVAWAAEREVWHPGWTASIDGQELGLHRANLALMGAWIPPGKHKIEPKFRPLGWRVGVVITAVSIVISIFLFSVMLWKRRQATS